ncbi:MAG TPA: hypothetical protein VEX88_05625 [Glaciibacter sp.]|nr:hypothetical protein [Glaciibacter sp.]
MTLGNNQPPLTRRQVRELARQAQPGDPIDTPDEQPEQGNSGNVGDVAAPSTIQLVPTAPAPSDAAYTTLSRRELRTMMAAEAASRSPEELAEPGVAVDDTGHDDTGHDTTGYDDTVYDANGYDEDDGIDDAVEPDAVEMVEIETDADAAPADGTPKLNPPVGHWSVARDVDEDVTVSGQHQPLDQLMARGIAAGGIPTTTNALILPSIPQQAPGSGPLTSTGEVLVTGSIDLPRSLGSTGQHPNTFDSSEMDHLLDQLDETAPTSSVAPVSASKAVSSHASTRGVMTPPKKQAISVPTVLSVTGAVLGVGVLALILGGPVFNIF